MKDNSRLPAYLLTLAARLEEMGYGEDFHIPASLADLKAMAPDLAHSVSRRPKPEQDLLFRCLGEAQAALLFEQYDALASGSPLSEAMKRSIFVRSFTARLRSAYGRLAVA